MMISGAIPSDIVQRNGFNMLEANLCPYWIHPVRFTLSKKQLQVQKKTPNAFISLSFNAILQKTIFRLDRFQPAIT